MWQFSRSIIDGCKRSTGLARVYTLRMANDLDKSRPPVELFLHVDDVSNAVNEDKDRSMMGVALDYAINFKEHTDRLLLEIQTRAR